MTIIEEIKDHLLIEDVVGKTVKLTRTGKNLRGLCPFHTEQTGSFFVFSDSQRFKCFGCGAAGDVFDFVIRQEGWDMPTAIRELARLAGVEVRPLTAVEKRDIERRREKEAVFAVAAEFFHTAMGLGRGDQAGSGSPGLDYARQRGFTDETIRAAGLGYFGEDWGALREALQRGEVDMECPAAVALVGLRGDLQAWGEAWDIAPAAQWVEQGKIPAMPPHLLIYPHVLAGRVTYLSGRRITAEGAKSWNPTAILVGEKQPYFNWLWGRAQREDGTPFAHTVMVEGQACALTLGQWQIPACALAGCAL